MNEIFQAPSYCISSNMYFRPDVLSFLYFIIVLQLKSVIRTSLYTGLLSSLGVPGVPWHNQILAGQLTLSQPGGTYYAHLRNYYWHPRIFRPSDGPAYNRGYQPSE